MKEGGSIINVASIQAYQPSSNILDYASTKGAIVTFSKGLAQDLIERGIRVNAVAPGPVWTPLIQQSFDKEKVATFGKNHPMERPAQPSSSPRRSCSWPRTRRATSTARYWVSPAASRFPRAGCSRDR